MKKYKTKILCTVLSCLTAVSTLPLSIASAEESPSDSFTYKMGDCNLDGKININDATHIQKLSAQLIMPENSNDISYLLSLFFGDADGDKELNVKDATAVQKFCAGYAQQALPINQPVTVAKSDLIPESSTDDEPSTSDEIKFDGEKSMGEFSFELFRTVYGNPEYNGQNQLVSPLSMMYALAMVTNGADGNTYKQLAEKISNSGEIDDLNEYLLEYANALKNNEYSKVLIANSVWNNSNENHNHPIMPDFNETLSKYYNTEMYSRDFCDQETLDEINKWCSDNTDGMIKEALSELPADAVMALINALLFDAKWYEQYSLFDVGKGEFNGFGKTSEVEYMHGSENGGTYISDDDVIGFSKEYEGGYSFVALMPRKSGEEAFNNMVSTMDYERFTSLYKNQISRYGLLVYTSMPKFKGEYSYEMVDILKAMGINDAFVPQLADFGKIYSDGTSAYISKITHKTVIENSEAGTKAGAVSVIIEEPTEAPYETIEKIDLDRPFMYAIVSSNSGTPLFIGTVTSL